MNGTGRETYSWLNGCAGSRKEKTMTYLPEEFLKRMQEMLGEEYEEFLASYEQPRTYGLRVNTRKMTPEEFEERKIFPVKRIPWVENGFFYEGDVRPAQHPLYAAGAYYLQEPSAMTPAAQALFRFRTVNIPPESVSPSGRISVSLRGVTARKRFLRKST